MKTVERKRVTMTRKKTVKTKEVDEDKNHKQEKLNMKNRKK